MLEYYRTMNPCGGIGNAITLLDKLESALQSMRAIVDIFFGFVVGCWHVRTAQGLESEVENMFTAVLWVF